MSRPRRERGFSLVELLVVLAIIAVLIGLLLPAVQKVRGAAARSRCQNNLRQIGLALHQYHGVAGALPPGLAVKRGGPDYPYMSWMTRLLPYVEQEPLWRQTVEAYRAQRSPWLDPPYVGLATVMPVYACPSDVRTRQIATVRSPGLEVRVALTSYLGNEGTDLFTLDGVLYADSRIRFADVTDGTSRTLAAGERPPSVDTNQGWWYAGGGQLGTGSCDVILGARERNALLLLTSCPRGPYSFGPGRLDNLCDQFHFWSLHAGGANFLMLDGSAHFLRYAAAPLLPALATRSGGEAAPLPD